jgi:hypothetical protein
MVQIVELLRLILAAVVQSGLAFRAGRHAERQDQIATDQEAAENAQTAAKDAAAGDRDDLLDRLRRTGSLRQ